MPWKETNVLDQRNEFIFKVFQKRASFRSLCVEYGISAKTGYKWLNRFLEDGAEGLEDRSRRPHGHSNQLDETTICRLIRFKRAHPSWGPKKIVDLYARQYGNAPSRVSVNRVLDKAGLVKRQKRRRVNSSNQRIINRVESNAPNDVWTVDFKGWWYTQDYRRCEPLTVRDDFSRYVLAAVPLESSRAERVRKVFEKLFITYGMPHVIRSDNGVPFASARSVFGLTKLSAWMVALGIRLDRIRPGCPYENGGHERMHRDIRNEVQGVAQGDLKHHEALLEVWRQEFNNERPHEALNMKTPAEVYKKSSRKYNGTPDKIDYPGNFLERKVNATGKIRIHNQVIFITTSLSGWTVGLEPNSPDEMDVHFANLNIGNINLENCAFAPHPIAAQ